MALFGVGRGKARDKQAVPGPAVLAPRRSLDGWTLEGTPLAARFGRDELRELATLMHGVSAGMDTPWTYERAADMLEENGERPQALAVLDAYFLLPDRIREANSVQTRTLGRRRHRLRKRLGAPPPATADTPALAELAGPHTPALPAAPAPTPLPAGREPLALPAAPPAPPAPPALVIPPKPTAPPPLPPKTTEDAGDTED
ncbi:hypothetical protein [Yinghuangia soli]|uniref:Uncharacterized protein n=1 Tax=Yinghuangia soli TaxID=2908204 RepID=A0AA41U0K7_9ACTN|nr:hypothetical protein [Yinghuangia soli]MCF2529918.1 hypothetical protein [Yinghuangia soli]